MELTMVGHGALMVGWIMGGAAVPMCEHQVGKHMVTVRQLQQQTRS